MFTEQELTKKCQEWWTVKKFPDGDLIAFESISMRRIIMSCHHPTLKNPETWRRFDCEHYKHFECNKADVPRPENRCHPARRGVIADSSNKPQPFGV